MRIPIFPLNTVLFPGGPLPLRVFESRYIDMVSSCLKSESPFGVVLISEGNETGASATFDIGTTATITDWYQGSDGILGVTATGGQRFRIIEKNRQSDGLNIADVEPIDDEPAMPLPAQFLGLGEILENILDDLGRLYEDLPRQPQDAVWTSYRFLEVLPVELQHKQRLLESNDTLERLQFVHESLAAVRGSKDQAPN